MPTAPTVAAGTLSLLLFIGGGVGYARKGSVASLAAGAVLGAVYSYAAWLLAQTGSAEVAMGRKVALGNSLLLAVAMAVRFVQTQAPVPRTLTILGAAASAYFAFAV